MKKETTAQRRVWLWEFSKRIVVTVATLFVVVFLYAAVLLWINPDSTAADSLISNMADIFKVTVVAYAVKAGFENVSRIKKTEE